MYNKSFETGGLTEVRLAACNHSNIVRKWPSASQLISTHKNTLDTVLLLTEQTVIVETKNGLQQAFHIVHM